MDRKRLALALLVDIVGLVGVALFLEGVRRIYVPLAFLVAGAVLATWAWWMTSPYRRRRANE